MSELDSFDRTEDESANFAEVEIADKLLDSVFSPLSASENAYCFNQSRNIGCN